MNDHPNSDFADEDIMDVLAQHFQSPPEPQNGDDLPKLKYGEELPGSDDIPAASEVWELVDPAEAPKFTGASKKGTKNDHRPELRLFDDNYDENQCGEHCALLIKKARTAFRHGELLKELREDTETGEQKLIEIDPATFPSRMSELAVIVRFVLFRGEWLPFPKRMSKYKAEILLKTRALLEKVPPVALLVPCPVLAEDEAGTLNPLGFGYHNHRGGLIITKKNAVESSIPLEKARDSIRRLMVDTLFASPQDGWRDLASLLTPALAMGGFIKGPVPIDLSVAEEFESGKGYRQQVIAAFYCMKLHTIPTAEGGVGHRDESVATAMSQGRYAIQIDNIVGEYNSPFMASLMTAEDFSTRIPYSIATGLNPRRHIFFVTSNGAKLTPDIASRCNVVRLLKRPPGYTWTPFPEGDLLDHVRAQQPYYLGCVFRIIKAWHDAGKPRPENSSHRFREWSGVIEGILETVFEVKGVFEDHRAAQDEQSGSPSKVVKTAMEAFCDQFNHNMWFSAADITAFARQNHVHFPNVEPTDPPEKIERQIGILFARFFPSGFSDAEATIGGCKVRRTIRNTRRPNGAGTFPTKVYSFERLLPHQSSTATSSNGSDSVTPR